MKTNKIILPVFIMVILIYLTNIPAISQQPDSFAIHTIGHGSLMFEYDDIVIHVDPYSTQANYDLLPKADLIFVTHGHSDHYDLTALNKVKYDSTLMICTQAVENLGTYSGSKMVMNNGDSLVIKNIPVKAVPAYNMEGSYHLKGIGNGYILTFGEKNIYIAGDTDNIPEMDSLGDIDIAFIPMNLPYTMTPEEAADAAKKIQPEILYIYHFGNSDTAKLRNLLSDQDMQIRIGKSVFNESAVKEEPLSALQHIHKEIQDVTFYPNPIKDLLLISGQIPASRLFIYDFNGKLLFNIQLNSEEQQQIDLITIKAGTYIVKIEGKHSERNSILIKE